MEGTTIGPYLVRSRLGKGGGGEVYLATEGEREVAIKLIAPTADPIAWERFRQEAEILSRIRHPNIVRIERFVETRDGRTCLVMERLVGSDLRSVVKERGGLMLSEVVDVIRPLCSALHQVHEAGIVHRDVKATNVFLAGDHPWRVVLLDFGIAKIVGATSTTLGRLIPGTPTYMAPEQLLGREVDRRTDVYALGVLTFYLLTGKHPFRHESSEMLGYLHLHARRPKPSSVKSDVPSAVDDVVVRAMSRDPDRRPEEAVAFGSALERAIREAQLLDTLI